MTTVAEPAPFVVVGGYLGSGKTTLVNHVVRHADGARVVVLVNDFGSVNVDADLLRSTSADLLELENGCVCCSLQDGMAAAVRRIRELAPDLVLVEVSGVGDPAAVAAWGDHPGFRRGPVVVCADAMEVRRRAGDRWVGDTVRRQLAAADLLLLTKTDLVGAEETAAVTTWLSDLAGDTPHLADRDALVDRLLGQPVGQPADRPGAPSPGGSRPGPPDDHTTRHREWTVEGAGPVDLDALRAALSALPATVVRAKGVLRTRERPDRRTVLHLVGRRIDASDDGPWRADRGGSRLVVIGTGPGDDGAGSLGADLDRTLRPLFGEPAASLDPDKSL